MIENLFNIKTDEDVRIEQVQKQQAEYTLIGKERRVPGHILYSYNTVTGEIKQAEIIVCKDVDFITRLPVHSPKVTVEPNCVYRQALNRRNFVKRLKREGII